MKKFIFALSLPGLILMSSLSASVDDWSIRIGVKSAEARDSYNFIGISPSSSYFYDAKDLPEPPPSPGGISLYFPHEDWAGHPGRYSTDFRGPLAGEETYAFTVDFNQGGPLTLFWTDLDKLPEGYSARLVHVRTGHTVDMRQVGDFSFVGLAGVSSTFRIVITWNSS